METLQKIAAALKIGVAISTNAQFWAAVRNLITAIGALFSLLGFAALSPETISKIISIATQLGIVIGALSAFVGLLLTFIPPLIASFKASQGEQVKAVNNIAQNINGANAPAAQAAVINVVNAVKEIAQDPLVTIAPEAKDAMISATIALPEVNKIIAEPSTANASPSNDVISSDQVKVIENASGEEVKTN